jgi:uncharacterized protein
MMAANWWAALTGKVAGGIAKEFIDAAALGDAIALQAILAKGVNVNAKDDKGRTALMFAAANGRHDVVRALIENGAKLDVKNKLGETALMYAASCGHFNVVRTLLDKGADINAKREGGGNNGETALMLAASSGQLKVVQTLIDSGADIHAKTLGRNGFAALNFAGLSGRHQVMQALLDAGSEPVWLEMALDQACRDGRSDLVKEILRTSIVKTLKYPELNVRAAASNGDIGVLKALLHGYRELSASVMDKMQETIRNEVFTTFFFGNTTAAQNLIKSDFLSDSDRTSVLIFTVRVQVDEGDLPSLKKRTQLIEALIDAGVDVQAPDEHGRTALSAAKDAGHPGVYELVVSRNRMASRRKPKNHLRES